MRKTLDRHALLSARAWRSDCAGAAAAMCVGKGGRGRKSPLLDFVISYFAVKFLVVLVILVVLDFNKNF